jgi:glucose dehydrogenase
LFQGGEDAGELRAIDATNGDILWTFRTGTGFGVSPVTYLGPDGEQYVAVIGSNGAASEQVGPVAADAEPDAAARYQRLGSALYVFSLREQVAQAN